MSEAENHLIAPTPLSADIHQIGPIEPQWLEYRFLEKLTIRIEIETGRVEVDLGDLEPDEAARLFLEALTGRRFVGPRD